MVRCIRERYNSAMPEKISIKGRFDGRAVVLAEPASLVVEQEVWVVIEPSPSEHEQPATRKSLAGLAKGMFEMRDDFNDPLDSFAEYR